MKTEIAQDFIFEAAHFLPAVPEGHRCRRLHGHTYGVTLHVAGTVEEKSGWVVDFHDIEQAFVPIRDALDHRLLNDVPGLENPTAERIAAWIFTRLQPFLPGLVRVVVHENPSSRAIVEA